MISRDAVIRHIDEDDRRVSKITTPSGEQEMTVINESGLYSLILSSKLPTAKKFKRWVTGEVLPSIRKNGGYIVGQEILSDDELIAKAFSVANNKIEEQHKQNKLLAAENEKQQQIIDDLKPKADYTDTVLNSDSLVTITQIAKDYGMSGMKMNKLLAEHNVQYKQSGQWLLYSKYQDCGYTQSVTYSIEQPNGEVYATMETKWTQKGRMFIHDLLRNGGIIPMSKECIS